MIENLLITETGLAAFNTALKERNEQGWRVLSTPNINKTTGNALEITAILEREVPDPFAPISPSDFRPFRDIPMYGWFWDKIGMIHQRIDTDHAVHYDRAGNGLETIAIAADSSVGLIGNNAKVAWLSTRRP